MAEPFVRFGEIVLPPLIAANGTKIVFQGLENIPERGGALLTLNHTSYLDWLPASYAAYKRHRRLRFMIKSEMQDVKAVNYVIKHARLIPVDRQAGHDAFMMAVQQLRQGELVGMHPEATISRSFELRPFKTGAVRMALEAHVPLIPLVVWGAHRIWPKDHPKHVVRNRVPITVAAGRPLAPVGDVDHLNAVLRREMQSLLYRVQEEYPHPPGAYWVPRRLGGSAPSPDDSKQLRAAELLERVRKHEIEQARRQEKRHW
jgi:1-acyl-sn-glycerol-3-phosphate acyltransferase